VITTASAVLLGVIRLAQPWLSSRNVTAEACVLGIGFALTALVAVWVSLGYGRWFFKIIALPAVAALVSVLFIAIEGHGGTNQDLGIAGIVLTQTIYMTLILLVLRRCGYRLLRKLAAVG
ncbi:MAG TPA: hypothetical protein VFI31_00080, partial [Pirellulales bacterium]|nr:hypothetical protein [Pirellulales bacterium]